MLEPLFSQIWHMPIILAISILTFRFQHIPEHLPLCKFTAFTVTKSLTTLVEYKESQQLQVLPPTSYNAISISSFTHLETHSTALMCVCVCGADAKIK